MRSTSGILAATIGALFIATPIAAAVVCNEEGDCWRVMEKCDYKPVWRLRVYCDDWEWSEADNDKCRWREGKGRGYWRDGHWIEF